MKTTNKVQELVNHKINEAINQAKEAANTNKKTAKKTKKATVTKEVAKDQEISLIEQVVSHREVKYIYPEGITDTLAKKKWRQATRNALHKLEREMLRITDQNSQEYIKAKKAYEDYKNQVLKPEQVA